MKKVLLINSSKRKQNTYRLLSQIAGLLDKDNVECEIINLHSYNIKQCVGCETCLRKGFCPIKDDYFLLHEKLKDVDGIVIGTPVYMRNISSMLKTFYDRTCRWYHRTEIAGKPVFSVITTAYSGVKPTSNYIKEVNAQWGTIDCGYVSRNAINIDTPVKNKTVRKFKHWLNTDISKYKPSLRQLLEFQTQRILAKKVLDIDKQYWIGKGWMYSDYYYKCKINIVKRVISKVYFAILNRVIPEK